MDPPPKMEYEARVPNRRGKPTIALVIGLISLLCVVCLLLRFLMALFGPLELSK